MDSSEEERNSGPRLSGALRGLNPKNVLSTPLTKSTVEHLGKEDDGDPLASTQSVHETRGSRYGRTSANYNMKYHPMDEVTRPKRAAKVRSGSRSSSATAERDGDGSDVSEPSLRDDSRSDGLSDAATIESDGETSLPARRKRDPLATRQSARASAQKAVDYNTKHHPQDYGLPGYRKRAKSPDGYKHTQVSQKATQQRQGRAHTESMVVASDTGSDEEPCSAPEPAKLARPHKPLKSLGSKEQLRSEQSKTTKARRRARVSADQRKDPKSMGTSEVDDFVGELVAKSQVPTSRKVSHVEVLLDYPVSNERSVPSPPTSSAANKLRDAAAGAFDLIHACGDDTAPNTDDPSGDLERLENVHSSPPKHAVAILDDGFALIDNDDFQFPNQDMCHPSNGDLQKSVGASGHDFSTTNAQSAYTLSPLVVIRPYFGGYATNPETSLAPAVTDATGDAGSWFNYKPALPEIDHAFSTSVVPSSDTSSPAHILRQRVLSVSKAATRVAKAKRVRKALVRGGRGSRRITSTSSTSKGEGNDELSAEAINLPGKTSSRQNSAADTEQHPSEFEEQMNLTHGPLEADVDLVKKDGKEEISTADNSFSALPVSEMERSAEATEVHALVCAPLHANVATSDGMQRTDDPTFSPTPSEKYSSDGRASGHMHRSPDQPSGTLLAGIEQTTTMCDVASNEVGTRKIGSEQQFEELDDVNQLPPPSNQQCTQLPTQSAEPIQSNGDADMQEDIDQRLAEAATHVRALDLQLPSNSASSRTLDSMQVSDPFGAVEHIPVSTTRTGSQGSQKRNASDLLILSDPNELEDSGAVRG